VPCRFVYMKKRRPVRIRRRISQWERPGDHELTEYLGRLEQVFEKSSSKNGLTKFVSHVIRQKLPIEFRLRLLFHIQGSFILERHFLYPLEGEKQARRIERECQKTFDKWWNSHADLLRTSYPDPAERVRAARALRKKIPAKLHTGYLFNNQLERAVDVFIQRTKAESAQLVKPAVAATKGLGRKGSANGPQPEKSLQPIHWTGADNLLIDLFEVLARLNKISPATYQNRWDLICDHFIGADGEPYKKKNLQELWRFTRNNNTRFHQGRPKEGPVLEGELQRLIELQEKSEVED
jgi:hypothetical protein